MGKKGDRRRISNESVPSTERCIQRSEPPRGSSSPLPSPSRSRDPSLPSISIVPRRQPEIKTPATSPPPFAVLFFPSIIITLCGRVPVPAWLSPIIYSSGTTRAASSAAAASPNYYVTRNWFDYRRPLLTPGDNEKVNDCFRMVNVHFCLLRFFCAAPFLSLR